MPSLTTSRNIQLTYTRLGQGEPLICVPGGPLLPATYLGTLGDLDQHTELILLDPPTTPMDTSGIENGAADALYRCDNLAEDLESLRQHLRLERLTLLGHSAGANIILRYAERYPAHVARVLLITPSTRAVGIDITDEARTALARSRAAEPWYGEASAALTRIQTGQAGAEDWNAIAPFSYGRWDKAAAEYNAVMDAARNPHATTAFGAEDAFDPPATRTALSVLHAPVTIIAGALDIGLPPATMEELAALFPTAQLTMLEGAGHFPWIDQPRAFITATQHALSAR